MRKKIMALLLSASMIASMVVVPAAAAQFDDMGGHWSSSSVERWSTAGVLNGDGAGNFNPDKEMTRAEFAQMLCGLMGYTKKAQNTFADVPDDAWYADAILKLNAAGVMAGVGNNMAAPNDPISREQAAVLLCRAMGIKPSANANVSFNDAGSVSSWARDAVAALTERGMINGVGNNTFAPALNINRASVAKMVDNMVAEYVTEKGTTITGEVKGVIIIKADDVKIEDATLSETVIIAPAAENANVTMTGSTKANDVVVAAEGAKITVGKDAEVGSVTVDAPKAEAQVSGKADSVVVTETAKGAKTTVDKGAEVKNVTVAAPDVVTQVSGKVDTVTVAESADGAKVTANSGATIGSVDTKADNTSVTANSGSNIGSVSTSGSGTNVSGGGKVDNFVAEAGATKPSVTTSGTKVENNSNSSVSTGSNSTIKPGETGTSKPSTSGSGGSSGGSSGSGGSGGSGSDQPSDTNKTQLTADNTTIAIKSDLKYTGSAIEAVESVTYNVDATTAGVTLTKGTDYTVTYALKAGEAAVQADGDVIDAGGYTATITGTGTYSGTVTKEFTVAKAAQTITVDPATVSVAVGGTATVTVDAKGAVSAESSDTAKATVAVDGSTVTITGVAEGSATITITAGETGNYEAVAEAKTVGVTVTKAGGDDKTEYTITVNEAEHGTVTASVKGNTNATYAVAGDTVTLTVRPDAGYTAGTPTVTPANGTAVAVTAVSGETDVYSFTMPAANVTVSATFSSSPDTPPEGGKETQTITVKNDGVAVASGTEVYRVLSDTKLILTVEGAKSDIDAVSSDTSVVTVAFDQTAKTVEITCVDAGTADVKIKAVENDTYAASNDVIVKVVVTDSSQGSEEPGTEDPDEPGTEDPTENTYTVKFVRKDGTTAISDGVATAEADEDGNTITITITTEPALTNDTDAYYTGKWTYNNAPVTMTDTADGKKTCTVDMPDTGTEIVLKAESAPIATATVDTRPDGPAKGLGGTETSSFPYKNTYTAAGMTLDNTTKILTINAAKLANYVVANKDQNNLKYISAQESSSGPAYVSFGVKFVKPNDTNIVNAYFKVQNGTAINVPDAGSWAKDGYKDATLETDDANSFDKYFVDYIGAGSYTEDGAVAFNDSTDRYYLVVYTDVQDNVLAIQTATIKREIKVEDDSSLKKLTAKAYDCEPTADSNNVPVSVTYVMLKENGNLPENVNSHDNVLTISSNIQRSIVLSTAEGKYTSSVVNFSKLESWKDTNSLWWNLHNTGLTCSIEDTPQTMTWIFYDGTDTYVATFTVPGNTDLTEFVGKVYVNPVTGFGSNDNPTDANLYTTPTIPDSGTVTEGP